MRSTAVPAGRTRRGLLALTAVLALVAAACSSGGSDAGDDTTTTTTAEGSETTIAEGDLPPCEVPEAPPEVEPVGSEAAGELLTAVTVEPGPNSSLSASVSAEADQEVTLDVVASAGDRTVEVPTSAASTTPEVALVGMVAETEYSVAVTATGADGATETVDATFTTGSLPGELPPVEVTESAAGQVSPGVTLFNSMWWGGLPSEDCKWVGPDNAGWVLGVDEAGEVVWYYEAPVQITDVSTTERGTLLLSMHEVLIREIDLLGTTIGEQGTLVATEYNPTDFAGTTYAGPDTVPVDIDSSHHELYELPSGNRLTLSTEIIELDAEATEGLCDGAVDEDDNPIPDPEAVVGDVVVELTPDGEVVQEWPISAVFDPLERQGSDLCILGNPLAPPNWFYPDREGLRDWTHGNAVVLVPETNTLMVSLRHLDAILGIRYADDDDGPAGELLWDLSPEGTLELTEGEFSYHGHAVEPQADGTILYYDNGNGRPGSTQAGGDEPPYSRAVIYELDPEAGTATQLWEHRDESPEGTPQFTGFLGDADRLANGNVLITHGGGATEAGLNYARLIEVVPGVDGTPDEIVWAMTLGDLETIGYTIYRAERLPSLYFGAEG